MQKSLSFLIYLIVSFLVNFGTWASSATGEHLPSAGDLKWKFISFFIVMFFVVRAAKKPIKEAFKSTHDEIREKFNEAENKDKEAQLKLKTFEDKMANLKNQVQEIIGDANDSLKRIDERIAVETKERLQIIEKELEAKLVSEKSFLERKLNQDIIEEVIGSAKEKISKNSEMKSKVTKKLMVNI